MLPTVAHSVSSYLFLTGSWIYSQLRYAQRVRPIVLTSRVENYEHFRFEPVYSLDRLSTFRRLMERAERRLLQRVYWPFQMRAMRAEGAKLLHSHFGQVGYGNLELARRAHVPHVVTFYGYDVSLEPQRNPIWRDRYRQLFAAGDAFMAEGNHLRRCLIDLGCPPEKAHVQRLGVALDTISFLERRPPEDGVVRILIAGSFVEKKGIPDAIAAIGKVRSARRPLHVTLIGDASVKDPRSMEEKRRILAAIEAARLGDCIALLGYQPHEVLMAEAAKSHVFISPSRIAQDGDTEGGAPVTITEMSASGLPILSTHHCDIPEVVVDGKSGYLVPERDVAALAERLASLVDNPDRWVSMGNYGRAHVEQWYDVRKQAKLMEMRYLALLNGEPMPERLEENV